MKFGVSEGMVLAASGDGPGIFLLEPDSGRAGYAHQVTGRARRGAFPANADGRVRR